jgi:hypothetical protein
VGYIVVVIATIILITRFRKTEDEKIQQQSPELAIA